MTLEELVVKISGDTSGLENSFKKIAGTAGKAIGAASVAAAAGITALTKSAIDSYADYEQLIGGVETLFKDSAGVVEEYANNAYKTAGLSANEYMESVTSFSASLLQSVGGDTATAAEAANNALTDMADNANKMGTSMESIQNAYQGFAKQNYTMLDNLKLGYGGTKEEMQRLLADAREISGIEYDISNLNDVYSAIHVIQTELGITGTTAKEASSTISGSAQMMKSAWANLITGIADENADFEGLVGNLVESLMTFLGNIMPRVEVALQGIVQMVQQLAPMLAETLPGLLESLLPNIIEAITALIESLLAMLPEVLPTLIEGLTAIFFEVVNALVEVLPELVESLMVCFSMLLEAISQHLPELTTALVDGLIQISESIIQNLPTFLDAFLQLLLSFVDAILKATPQIIEALPDLIEEVVNFFVEALPQLVEAGVKLFTALVEAMPEIIETICEVLPDIIDSIIDTLIDNIDLIIDCGVELLIALVENLPEIIETIVEAIPEIITALVEAIISHLPDIIEAGANLIKGLFDGIVSVGKWLYGKLKEWCGNVLDWIKGFFGIHSPSVKMAEDGKYLVMGLANGITKNTSLATGALSQMAYQMENSFNPALSVAGVNKALNSVSGIKPHLTVEGENVLQATLKNGNNDIVSALVQTTKQLIGAIEDKDLSVSLGDDEIAYSAARGNNAYIERTGNTLFAY